MTRQEIHQHNRAVIQRVAAMVTSAGHRLPSYKAVTAALNRDGWRSTRGSPWTCRALYRLLQRQGVSGLNGLRKQLNLRPGKLQNGHFPTP